MKDSLGDRMKGYESISTFQFDTRLPVIARMDGRAFHAFTHKCHKPYDMDLIGLMTETTRHLVESTGAVTGYTQSDEITLVFYAGEKSQLYFGGKLQKMVSILASETTLYFNKHIGSYLGKEFIGKYPLFDARVFSVPSKDEAVNCLIWREQDAMRNSVQMAARAQFSHKECENKDIPTLKQMLFNKGIDWEDYPACCKKGSYVQKKTMQRKFSNEEIKVLPEKHEARKNPDLIVARSEVNVVQDVPILSTLKNRIDFVFDGQEPVQWECMI